MKILQITNKVPVPPKDGGSIASFRLAQGLAKSGHRVHILAMNTSKHFVEPDIIRTYESTELKITPVWMDTNISAFKAAINLLFSRMPYNAVRFISSSFKKELSRQVKNDNPDLIILENLYPAAYLETIRKITKSPIAYRAHNVEFEIWERTAANSRGLKKLYLANLAKRIKRFEYWLINKYDLLIPITKRDMVSLEKMGNKKPAFILPTGYYFDKASLTNDEDSRVSIAHLGALDWLPNQEGLLWFIHDVWPKIRNKIPEIEFHVAGRNAPNWFKKELLAQGIDFHGEIDDAQGFIKSHKIHIVPLLSGSGMRIKIVEAMAYGRAVVTTSLGTEGIDTRHEKNIMIADDEETFARHTIRLINDNYLRREIGENAFTFALEKLDNDKLVGEFSNFLKKTLW